MNLAVIDLTNQKLSSFKMRLKILFLSHYFHPHIGGIETISEVLARTFAESGHEVHLLTWSEDNTSNSFPFKVIRNPNKTQLFRAHAWANLVFENNPCLRLSWPGMLFKRPSIVVLQTWLSDLSSTSGISNQIKHWSLSRADRVVAISDAVRKRCYPSATIIANSYNVDNFKIISGINRNSNFVFVGRLVSDKGAILAIQAIHHLLHQEPKEINGTQYSLTIVGDGPERNNLERAVADLYLENHVHFTGSLSGEKLARCLNQHKYLLVPSVWEEPFGIVALEGMACGCIPIVSDGGGLPDAVGNAGLKFKRGDVDALVQSIQRLVNNSTLEKQLKEAANLHVAAHHPRVIAKKYLTIIESICKYTDKRSLSQSELGG